jgi:hypothetical protein
MRDEMTLSKTAALKEARRYVGDIHRRSSTEYVFYAPYSEPGGATTEVRANSYWQAREYRTYHLVSVALELMGVEDKDLGHENHWEGRSVDWEIERAQQHLEIRNAPAVLNHVLREIRA